MLRFLKPFGVLPVFVPALFFASPSASHAAAPAPTPVTPTLVAEGAEQ